MPCFTLRSLGISQICSCRRTIRRLRRLPLSSKPSCSVSGKCFGKKREENATPFCDAHELCRLLKASANAGRRPDIIGFHTQILKCGLENQFFLQNTLVHSYLKCGVFESARKLFDQMSEKNVVSWNSMISGYAQNGFHEDALGLFREMRRQNVTPTNFTFPSVMKACGAIGRLAMAREFHNEIIRFAGKIEFDVAIQNALIDMYAKCAGLMDARQVFDGMTERDIFSWNAMLSGYLCNGRIQEALEIFWKIPVKNVVSWNALIQGLSQAGRHQEALALLFPMKSSGQQ